MLTLYWQQDVHTELCSQHSAFCNWSSGVEEYTRNNDPISICMTWWLKAWETMTTLRVWRERRLWRTKTLYSAHISILTKGISERTKEGASVQKGRWVLNHERKEMFNKRSEGEEQDFWLWLSEETGKILPLKSDFIMRTYYSTGNCTQCSLVT